MIRDMSVGYTDTYVLSFFVAQQSSCSSEFYADSVAETDRISEFIK